MATGATGSSFIDSGWVEGIGTTTAMFQNWDVVEASLYTLEQEVPDASQLLMMIAMNV